MIAPCGVWQGLGRFDFDGRPTHKVTSNVVSSLANPLVSPPLCVRLSNLCVALPKGLYPTLAKLAHNSEPPLFQLRLAVHNGRAFVGRPVLTRAVHYDETSNMLEVTEDVYVRGIPLDILVVLRVEVQVPIPDDLPQRKGCVVPQLLKGAPLLNPSLEKTCRALRAALCSLLALISSTGSPLGSLSALVSTRCHGSGELGR